VWKNLHFDYLTVFAASIDVLAEECVPSKDLAKMTIFTRLALADSSTKLVARDKYLVLTDDINLANHLEVEGVAVIKITHIRELAW
jgi:rRNA-processing protein FCF1